MSNIGHNTFAGEKLIALIHRVERLNEEKAAIQGDLKEVFSEAKSFGFCPKTMRRVITARKMDANDREESDQMFYVYMQAVEGTIARGPVTGTVNANKTARTRAARADTDPAPEPQMDPTEPEPEPEPEPIAPEPEPESPPAEEEIAASTTEAELPTSAPVASPDSNGEPAQPPMDEQGNSSIVADDEVPAPVKDIVSRDGAKPVSGGESSAKPEEGGDDDLLHIPPALRRTAEGDAAKKQAAKAPTQKLSPAEVAAKIAGSSSDDDVSFLE